VEDLSAKVRLARRGGERADEGFLFLSSREVDELELPEVDLDALRSPLSTHWHRTAATLEIDTHPSSAMTRLARLVHNSVDPNDPELELLYARALIGANHPNTALQRLTQLATALNSNDSKHFWHAWTLIIETTITSGNESDQDNARAHLTRLKLMNPKLGPEPYRSRLIEAQNTLHSQP
jgi:predicted Zn-dependent protease